VSGSHTTGDRQILAFPGLLDDRPATAHGVQVDRLKNHDEDLTTAGVSAGSATVAATSLPGSSAKTPPDLPTRHRM
jgi:hypothetical protein